MSEMKPCPFCGEKTIYHNIPSKGENWKENINCPCCLAQMLIETESEELIKAWNTRAFPDTHEELERSKIEIDVLRKLRDTQVERLSKLHDKIEAQREVMEKMDSSLRTAESLLRHTSFAEDIESLFFI